jgi:DnaK suppressor protein
MDLPTQARLKTLRDLLGHRLVELRADVRAAEQERLVLEEAGDRGDDDRRDDAMRGQLSALSDKQEERDREEMREVEAALHRLGTGTYGDCDSCGEPIPVERLLVQSAATRCAACQARHEAGA